MNQQKWKAEEVRRKYWQEHGKPVNDPPPQDPTWFNQQLIDIAGCCDDANGQPWLRAVWGQSETQWAFSAIYEYDQVPALVSTTGRALTRSTGKWLFTGLHMKYLCYREVQQLVFGGTAKNLKTGEIKQLTKKEAGKIFHRRPVRGLQPASDWWIELDHRENVIEVGRHNWIIEYLNFREEKDWDLHRHISGERAVMAGYSPDDLVDALGPYPENGLYTEMMPVETREGKYRALDQSVLDEVKAHLRHAAQYERETPEQSARRSRDVVVKAREKSLDDLRDMISHTFIEFRHQCLNESVLSVPDNYENSKEWKERNTNVNSGNASGIGVDLRAAAGNEAGAGSEKDSK